MELACFVRTLCFETALKQVLGAPTESHCLSSALGNVSIRMVFILQAFSNSSRGSYKCITAFGKKAQACPRRYTIRSPIVFLQHNKISNQKGPPSGEPFHFYSSSELSYFAISLIPSFCDGVSFSSGTSSAVGGASDETSSATGVLKKDTSA